MPSSAHISVIIPARDEEHHLPKCLASLKESFKQIPECAYEIIVVINRSTDRTESIALENNCIVVKDESKNLSMIRNAGLKAARGDVLVTIDADSWVSLYMMREIKKVMDKGTHAGGGVLIFPERWSIGIVCSGILIGLLGIWFRVTAGLFFFSRAALEATGGFDETRLSAEDIDFARRLKKFAKRNKLKFKNLITAHIVTSCRKFDKFGDWYFFTRLPTMIRLLKGNNEALANEIWYDFPRN